MRGKMALTSALDYGTFTEAIIETVKQNHAWHRVVSIDLETKIEKKTDFLTGERLLGIGLSRRAGSEVETRTLRLKDESDDAEIELLYEAARYLAPIKPLVLLGYNIAGYDYPLLNMKLKWHDDMLRARMPEGQKAVFPREYWGLKDALTRAYVLDMMHPLRYAIAEHDKTTAKYKSLADVVDHARFADVALMRRKQLATGGGKTPDGSPSQPGSSKAQPDSGNPALPEGGIAPALQAAHAKSATENKGKVIYEMWRTHDPNFERYLEGDVHDVLLLAEALYGIGKP